MMGFPVGKVMIFPMGKIARGLLAIAGRPQVSAPVAGDSKKETSITFSLYRSLDSRPRPADPLQQRG
jgi:hypothetical protein